MTHVADDVPTGTQFYTGYTTDDIVVLGFRGAQDTANWIENLDFAMVPYPGVLSTCSAVLL